jgi:hypothetical protein
MRDLGEVLAAFLIESSKAMTLVRIPLRSGFGTTMQYAARSAGGC